MSHISVSGKHLIAVTTSVTNEPLLSECIIYKTGNFSKTSPIYSPDCKYPGISVEYFYWLALALNFSFEIRLPANGSYGAVDENGQWDGAVGMVSRGEADLSLIPVFMLADRGKVVNYGPPFHDGTVYGFMFKTPTENKPMFSVFYPLNIYIYVALIATFILILCSSLLATVMTTHCLVFKKEQFFLISWHMLEMDLKELPRYFIKPVCILLFSWFLVAYTMANAYRSNLIVSAMGETDNLPMKNLEDATRLLSAGKLHLVVPKDNYGEFRGVLDALPSVSPKYAPWVTVLRNYTPAIAENTTSLIEFLSRPNYAFFGDVRSVIWFLRKDTLEQGDDPMNDIDLTLLPTEQSAPQAALIFRRDFPYREDFERAMTMVTDDATKRFISKYVPSSYRLANAGNKYRQGVHQDTYGLSVDQLVNLFSLWSIGCACAVATLFGEHACWKNNDKLQWWQRKLKRRISTRITML